MITLKVDNSKIRQILARPTDLHSLAQNIQEQVQANSPVQSGALRDSVTASVEGDVIAIRGERHGVPLNVQADQTHHHFADDAIRNAVEDGAAKLLDAYLR